MLWCSIMDHSGFGGLIRRKQPERKKIVLPPTRSPLNINASPKSSEPPVRSPTNIKVEPKVKKPQESPEVAAFKKRADELRRRVTARDPGLATTTRLEPRLPLKTEPDIKITPRSHFEWVQAA